MGYMRLYGIGGASHQEPHKNNAPRRESAGVHYYQYVVMIFTSLPLSLLSRLHEPRRVRLPQRWLPRRQPEPTLPSGRRLCRRSRGLQSLLQRLRPLRHIIADMASCRQQIRASGASLLVTPFARCVQRRAHGV